MRIAVVGAGISGLVAAYHLHREHEVTIFEAGDYVGGHTHTVDVSLNGANYAIDTGFIVFNLRNYPNFTQLLNELKVESQPTTMGFSVRDDRTGLEYSGETLNGLFAQRRNLFNVRFHRMVRDILRFHRAAVQQASSHDETFTVGEFLQEYRYSSQFADQFLLPMGSAIWSCPRGEFANFPVRFIIEFYLQHGLLTVVDRPVWRVITGGSRNYVTALTQGFRERIRLQTPVIAVRRADDGVDLGFRQGEGERFDHVLFACHSDQALRILGEDATSTEREVLSAFPYVKNGAVLHTDASVLPRSRRAWSSWNYRIPQHEAAAATVTYNMTMLQDLRSDRTFCVTLNDEDTIDPQTILGKYEYDHPVFTRRRAEAQSRRHEILNVRRTSFCGAYWGNGFHEDGVNSALAVVDALRSSPGSARKSTAAWGTVP